MMTLMIHPRRGLFQLTVCTNCGHMMECQNCDAKLTTYERSNGVKELICHQCQSQYSFPKACPSCGKHTLHSKFGGIDKLYEILTEKLGLTVAKHAASALDEDIALSTRIFDPATDYSKFTRIVFIKAENLLSHPDYTVTEEVSLDLMKLFSNLAPETQIVFDTVNANTDLFSEDFKSIQNLTQAKKWIKQTLLKESRLRNKFLFPPATNIVLVTSQERNYQQSVDRIQEVRGLLMKLFKDEPDIQI
jgi:primosomal protein N'